MGEVNKSLEPPEKSPMQDQIEEDFLQTVILMVETGLDLKERCNIAEKHTNNMKLLFTQVNRTIDTLQSISRYSLQQAKRLLKGTKASNDEVDKLLAVIDRQLATFDDVKEFDNDAKHRISDNLTSSNSNKSLKYDTDEKYPENWSKDSSIDLNNVVNLPPVPEDVFSSFYSTTKPKRSSSLSSLKSMRKVKLFLQRAETSDDEDNMSSDTEDHELGQKGDSDDGNSPKKCLGDITEETQD